MLKNSMSTSYESCNFSVKITNHFLIWGEANCDPSIWFSTQLNICVNVIRSVANEIITFKVLTASVTIPVRIKTGNV
jgi:hypothetical protein